MMTLQSLPSPLWFPSPPTLSNSEGPSIRSNLVDADGEYYGVSFQPPASDNGKSITHIWWRTATVTTGGDMDVRLETVDGAGLASGTLATTNSNLVVAVGSGDDNTAFFSELTAPHTVVFPETLCAIVKRPGGSSFVGNLASHRRALLGYLFPYEVRNLGSDTKDGLSVEPPCLTVRYSDGTYYRGPGMWPVMNLGSVVFGSGDANAENGLVFQLPMPARIIGAWCQGGADAAGADYSFNLYAGATAPGGSALATVAVDAEHIAVDNVAAGNTRFITPVFELAKDTEYRLVLQATTANNLRIAYYEVDDAARLLAMPGGANWVWTQDDGAGGWTDNGLRVPLMGLLLDQLDDGVGGGPSPPTTWNLSPS